MKLTEECSCGAGFAIETDERGPTSETIFRRVEKWRGDHQHPTPQGASAIGYPLPEANNGYDETGQPHGLGFRRQ